MIHSKIIYLIIGVILLQIIACGDYEIYTFYNTENQSQYETECSIEGLENRLIVKPEAFLSTETKKEDCTNTITISNSNFQKTFTNYWSSVPPDSLSGWKEEAYVYITIMDNQVLFENDKKHDTDSWEEKEE